MTILIEKEYFVSLEAAMGVNLTGWVHFRSYSTRIVKLKNKANLYLKKRICIYEI